MSAGRFIPAAAAALIACSCPPPARSASGTELRARQFEAEISRIEREDPASPAVLSARLTYIEFLLSESSDPCAKRLRYAQSELRAVTANPETQAMFPDGWAREADAEYRFHFARASCGPDASHNFDLWAAFDSARRAVELYRSDFDYRSTVIMQFDVATTLYQLGEKAAAIAALESAIAMDREYGFRNDAEVNYQQLLSWTGEPSSPERITALMADFPERKATLAFHWRTGDAAVAIESRRERLDGGKLNQSRAAARLDERVRGNPNGWSVSYRIGPKGSYDPGVWPVAQGSGEPEDFFPPAVLVTSSFEVSRTGDFERVSNSDAFASGLASDAARLVRAHAPAGPRAPALTDHAMQTTAAGLSPELLDAGVLRNYSLETAMWVGAALDQGIWYEISAPLSLPGIPRVVVMQKVQFAFTRTVPCSARDAQRACIELVLRVTPDEDALARWLAAEGTLLHYSASLDIRIVTDPQTLLPRAREERGYWYASVGNGKTDQLIESEHLTSSTSWIASQPQADR